MKHFETELPAGYEAVYTINAKNKRTGILLNLAGLGLFVLALLPFALFWHFHPYYISRFFAVFSEHYLASVGTIYLMFFGGFAAYIVLHELVHGAAYKLLTHQKLTFGITWSAAYCGVPQIYVYRWAMLIVILAPFAVFTVVLLALLVALRIVAPTFLLAYLALVLLFCSHICGCVGDLYGAWLMLFRFRDAKLLVRDTGPKQTFYLLKQK